MDSILGLYVLCCLVEKTLGECWWAGEKDNKVKGERNFQLPASFGHKKPFVSSNVKSSTLMDSAKTMKLLEKRVLRVITCPTEHSDKLGKLIL